jgi:signal transduction histidine kinase
MGCLPGLMSQATKRRLSSEAEPAVYRIAQAAASNATRHAHPTRISLGLHFNAVGVTLEVEDDGGGFAPPAFPGDLASHGHYGLVGMPERATRLGGHLSIRSSPGHGTKMVAFLPCESPRQPAPTPHLAGSGADPAPRSSNGT